MSSILQISKNLGMTHNVSLRVMDPVTDKVITQHTGHNAATQSMLLGIGHYLAGEGVFGQGPITLTEYVPKYVSLGTMGLVNQDEDEDGLPSGIGIIASDTEEKRFEDYKAQVPGFGADGYDKYKNNDREFFGLGPMFQDRLPEKVGALGGFVTAEELGCGCEGCNKDCKDCPNSKLITKSTYVDDVRETIKCELISNAYPRSPITYRQVLNENESEISETIDVVFSGMISTGALSSFREPNRNYIFVTEAGLWSTKMWPKKEDALGRRTVPEYDVGCNGLLAGYRIMPPNETNWDMSIPSNRRILKENILRVGRNQVVQVIWKVQIGAMEQLVSTLSGEAKELRWKLWNRYGDDNNISQLSIINAEKYGFSLEREPSIKEIGDILKDKINKE